MKKNNLLKTVLLLVFAILFLQGCRNEIDNINTHKKTEQNLSVKNRSKISFNSFKNETNLKLVSPILELKSKKSDAKKDIVLLDVYKIDTTNINKLEFDKNKTYTFRAYHLFENPNSVYNLVYFFKNNNWEYSLIKLLDNHKSKLLYDSRYGVVSEIENTKNARICYETVTIYEFHCTCPKEWNTCDMCNQCVSANYKTISYDCGGTTGGNDGGVGSNDPSNPVGTDPVDTDPNNPQNYEPIDPSGYVYDPNLPPSTDIEYLNAVHASNYWEQLTYSGIYGAKEWASQNPELYCSILDNYLNHYSATNNTNNLQFANWAINFFMQNPNISWTQFQNWFMGESEGQDGEYDLASEIAFQQQQFQKHSLPSMTSYENAFPSNPNATYPNYYRDAAPNYEVYNNYVGGRLKQLFNQNGGNIIGNPYRNACAVRQSFTHNKLGIMIPFQHNDHKGDYNWNYILTASKMGVFLEGTYGPPTHKLIGTDANDLKKIGDFLKGKTGIYLVINNDPSKNTGAGYTGHTDMIKNGYVSGGANVTNSSGQIVRGGIKYIYIWELK